MDRPLHVLHVIDGLGLGGAERMLVEIANRTVEAGYKVSVCVTRNGVARAVELDPRVRIVVLDRRRVFSFAASLRLISWIRSQKVDVIHCHMRSSTAFVVLLRMLRLHATPIVFHDHYGTIELDTSTPPWFRLGRRFVSHYVGVHDRLCDWARNAGMPAARTTMIANGLDLSRFTPPRETTIRADLGIDSSTVLGLLVASVRPQKGIEVFLDSIARSRHRGRVKIMIVGTDGEPAYAAGCRSRCTALGLDNVVTFLGARADVPDLLHAADFAVLSSLSESGPLVLLEYMAAGLPFVSTSVGDIGRRFAANGVPGFVLPNDTSAFTLELDTLLDLSAVDRRRRGELGRSRVTEHWDIRAAMPRWYEIYQKVAAR